MERGDLEASHREKLYIVIEGVLALVLQEHETIRRGLRKERHTTFHMTWYEVPLKRLIVIRDRYPNYELNLITFLGQDVAERAARYLTDAEVPYDEIRAWDFEEFVKVLPFKRLVRAIYDVEPDRLDHYGQLGVSVQRGFDF